MKKAKKKISIKFELAELGQAIEAARLLISGEGALEELDTPTRPAAAVLALVQARLRLLGRAIGGEVDPAWLWAPYNSAPEKPLPSDDPDLVLEEVPQKPKQPRARA